MRSVEWAPRVFLALTILLPGLAVAADAAQYEETSVHSASVDAASLPAVVQVKGMGIAVDAEKLDGYRGGSSAVSNTILPSGLVKDNTAINIVTGMNSINEGAFSNASGMPTVIQNTGANVLIQNSTIVNVQLQ